MKKLIYFLPICLFSFCIEKQQKKESKKDQFYYINTCLSEKDTLFFDKPKFDTAHYKIIAEKYFDNNTKKGFRGYVIKLTNEPAPIDGGAVYYLTKEFGVIYLKSTTWPCYRRLHSTNDSLEKRITLYLENILSNTELVTEGDIPLKFYDKNFFDNRIRKIKF